MGREPRPDLGWPVRQGFAALDPAQRRAVAQRGGRAVQARGTGHRWTPADARAAGKQGGIASAARRRGATRALVALLVLLVTAPLSAEYIRSRAVHRAFLKATGYPQGRPGFVVDHIFPLCAGGHDALENLQWQSIADARVKDRAEWTLCRAIRALVATYDAQWRPTP